MVAHTINDKINKLEGKMKYIGIVGSGKQAKIIFAQIERAKKLEEKISKLSVLYDLNFQDVKDDIFKIAEENPITVEDAICEYLKTKEVK